MRATVGAAPPAGSGRQGEQGGAAVENGPLQGQVGHGAGVGAGLLAGVQRRHCRTVLGWVALVGAVEHPGFDPAGQIG
jgi:hypothetical protein